MIVGGGVGVSLSCSFGGGVLCLLERGPGHLGLAFAIGTLVQQERNERRSELRDEIMLWVQISMEVWMVPHLI